MKLIELLDKAVDFKITEKTDSYFQAEFVSNNRTIVFDAGQIRNDDDELAGIWEIAFIERDKHGIGNWSVTKGGKEFEVFATIKNIIEKFLTLYDVKELKFTSEKSEDNRAKLYQRLFTRSLPTGWKLERDDKVSKLNTYFRIKGPDAE
jgi:hypothetical protein